MSARHDPGGAPAQAASALYGVPADHLVEYAHERTLAMDIRDTRAAAVKP